MELIYWREVHVDSYHKLLFHSVRYNYHHSRLLINLLLLASLKEEVSIMFSKINLRDVRKKLAEIDSRGN